MMDFRTYQQEVIDRTEETEGLRFYYAVLWLHQWYLPLKVTSLSGCAHEVIRIPGFVENKYHYRVPVFTFTDNVFRDHQSITDIILPETIEYIPEEAFKGCKNLKRITIPKKLKKIPWTAFDGCSALEDVYYEGSPDDFNRLKIKEYLHEVELSGVCKPGTPVEEVLGERLIHVPGNETFHQANIHFNCHVPNEGQPVYQAKIDESGTAPTYIYV